jgi:methionine-rich copper-binding protein CopC
MKNGALLGAVLMLGAAALAVTPTPAPAESILHLKLDSSTPQADQVVSESPDKIVLDFSQRPELPVSRIAVTGAQGAAELADVQRSEEDDTILWAAVEEPLADGAYTVNWVTSSGDGHPVRGEFSFTVTTGR